MVAVEPIRQVQLQRHAVQAITRRLGHCATDAVIGSTREAGGSVILHLNSGGNALAAQARLRSLGYRVEPTDYGPYASGHYGVQLRVSPGEAPSARWCHGSGIPPSSASAEPLGVYATPRGICSHCERNMPVRRDGTLRKHNAEVGTPVRART